MTTRLDGSADCWQFPRAKPLARGQTLVMSIVNLAPDSFSGAGAPTPERAAEQALALLAAGADLVDLGAESTRPGARPVDAATERRRLGETVALVRAATSQPISVDTYHPETAAMVLEQGADIINDITALRGGWPPEPDRAGRMIEQLARAGAHVILSHAPQRPETMGEHPAVYADVAAEVTAFLRERAGLAEAGGVGRERIWFDPGFGFAKDFAANRQLLQRLGVVAAAGYPVAVGVSRKRMIADALGLPPGERLEASLALAVMAVLAGAALVRVHDVAETVRAVRMIDAVRVE